MKATLLPQYVQPLLCGSTSSRPVNPDVVPVVDMDKNQWRSFRVDSVQSFEVAD